MLLVSLYNYKSSLMVNIKIIEYHRWHLHKIVAPYNLQNFHINNQQSCLDESC